MKRTPRDHDGAIRALRAEALKCEKRAKTATFDPETWEDRRAFIDWHFQKRARAAAMSIAAEHLAFITGKVERAEQEQEGGGMTLAEGIAALRARAEQIADAGKRMWRGSPERISTTISADAYSDAANYLASLASKPKRKKWRKP